LIAVAGVQIVTRKKLDPKKLKGAVIAFPVTNPLGMQFGDYVSPHDGVNINYAFPGSKDGSPSYRLANFIWEATKGSDLALDFHENASPCLAFSLVDRVKDRSLEKRAMTAAEAFGITVIRTGEAASFTLPGVKAGDMSFSTLCMTNGIPSFVPEVEGGPEAWYFRESQPNVNVTVRGMLNIFKKLGMIEGEIEPQTGITILKGSFEYWGIAKSNRGGFVDRLVNTGERIKKGTRISRILNAFGDTVETIRMPVDGYLWGWTAAGGSNRRHLTVHSGGNVAYIFREE